MAGWSKLFYRQIKYQPDVKYIKYFKTNERHMLEFYLSLLCDWIWPFVFWMHFYFLISAGSLLHSIPTYIPPLAHQNQTCLCFFLAGLQRLILVIDLQPTELWMCLCPCRVECSDLHYWPPQCLPGRVQKDALTEITEAVILTVDKCAYQSTQICRQKPKHIAQKHRKDTTDLQTTTFLEFILL